MTEQLYPSVAQAVDLADWSICGSDMIYNPHGVARAVFGEPDRDCRGDQFLYLFRRFGYPIYGWDDYKSLVSYFLTTPDDQVVLWCNPCSSPWLSFGYGIHPDLAREGRCAEYQWRCTGPRVAEWEAHPIHQRIDRAIRAAMNELFRPIPIRDTFYNIMGRVLDDSPYAQWEPAERSPQAGYGMGEYDVVRAASD